MVIIDTSFKRMQKLIGKNIPLKELDEALNDIGMEINAVEGDEVKIEITAERTDLITPEGLARAVGCYKGYTKKFKEIDVRKGNYVHKVEPSVKKYRPITRSFVVKNLKFTDEDIKSLMRVQEKIHDTYGRKRKKIAIGVYDLDNIKFPVIYSAKKPEDIKFVPLEMDVELNGRQILQKHPTGRDYAHLLEGFDKYPVQSDSAKQVLSMPPIINSENLGRINPKTTNLFVEATGTDDEALDNIMNILATMFYDWGGAVYSVSIDDGVTVSVCPNLKVRKRKVSVQFINRWIGLDLKPKDMINLLYRMGYDVLENSGDNITVKIPSVRTDIWHDADIADDVARGYGFNNIKPTLPNISTIGKMLPLNIFIEDVCDFMSTLDLLEVKTFALTSENDQFVKLNVKEWDYISLGKNTQDKSVNMVRVWMLPELMKALVANRNREYPQRIYEAGTVVIPDNNADVKCKNVVRLGCMLCEERADFTKIKQVFDALMDYLGKKYEIAEAEHSSFIEGRVGRVIVDGKKVGFIGEMHPKVLDNHGMKMPIAAFELNLTELFGLLG